MPHATRVAIILLGWCLALLSAGFMTHPVERFYILSQNEVSADVSTEVSDKVTPPQFDAGFVAESGTSEVHASAVHAMDNGIMAYWFGGSREGAADVKIYQAEFDGENWLPATPIIDRLTLQRDLDRYIRKVGNPVSYRWDDGTIWVFFVSVSLGGWAGSSINLIESTDNGQNWSPAKRLVTSPFLNISTLVRNAPVEYEDGTIGLPVYHEFLGKFAELLRIDRNGKVLAKDRLSRGTYALQPTIAPTSRIEATALLRYAGDPPYRVLETHTYDTGLTWSQPQKLPLANPNSAIATMVYDDWVIAVLNNTEDGRHELSIVFSEEDQWQTLHILEAESATDPQREFQFSYPSITTDNAGQIHILYTWNKTRIKHVSFNESWLAARLPQRERGEAVAQP
jgi:predicted neuraminidase